MPETSEQRALRSAVRGLLAGGPPGSADSARVWARLATEIGVAGLAIPDRFGGAGAGPAEVHVVQEELGRQLAGTPMLGSAVLATHLLLESGDEEACARLLPGLADGSEIAAVAWTTARGRWDPAEVACQATAGQDTWLADGEAHFVLDATEASVLLVPARVPGGIGLLEIRPGGPAVTITERTTMDQTRPLATVGFAGAVGTRIGGTRIGGTGIGGHAALASARDLAVIALAAEQAGAAARGLELTVGYTKTRVQFGRPIGGFQALQHRMADLYVLVQSATSLARAAAEAAARREPGLPLRAAAAKAYCSEALSEVAAEMIQLHGAIAMTWEHEAHRFFKRAHGAAWLLGAPGAHVERIAAAVIDGQ